MLLVFVFYLLPEYRRWVVCRMRRDVDDDDARKSRVSVDKARATLSLEWRKTRRSPRCTPTCEYMSAPPDAARAECRLPTQRFKPQ